MEKKSLLNWELLDPFAGKGEVKIFCLASLNIFVRSLVLLARKFWWLWGTWIFGIIIFSRYFSMPTPEWFTAIFASIGSYLMLATVRSSIERKDLLYFMNYFIFSWPIFLYWTILHVQSYSSIERSITDCIMALVLFFFLDTTATPLSLARAIRRTVVIFLRFLPSFVLLCTLLTLVTWPLNLALDFLRCPCVFVVQLFSFAILSVYYIKLKHKHYNLLFW